MSRTLEGWLDNAVWIILFFLLVPSAFAVTSWNSLPGTRLYGIRLAMENVLLSVAPSAEAKGQLYVSFTERGVRDATKVLSDSGSTVGLTYLSAHVSAAKENIQTTSNPQVRAQLAQRYITTLKEANATLEQQKQLMTTGSPSPGTPTPTSKPASGGQPTPTPTRAPTRTPTPTPQASEEPTPGGPIEEIEDTQDEIEDTIDELEDLSSSVMMGNDDDDKKDDKDKHKDKENYENKGNNEDKKDKGKGND